MLSFHEIGGSQLKGFQPKWTQPIKCAVHYMVNGLFFINSTFNLERVQKILRKFPTANVQYI